MYFIAVLVLVYDFSLILALLCAFIIFFYFFFMNTT